MDITATLRTMLSEETYYWFSKCINDSGVLNTRRRRCGFFWQGNSQAVRMIK